MAEMTTIQVSADLKNRLEVLKDHPRQSYNEIITKTFDKYESWSTAMEMWRMDRHVFSQNLPEDIKVLRHEELVELLNNARRILANAPDYS
ncbi:MAG: hypothetical protein PHW17_14240 [Desulfobacterales bacterium]|nr:hypothetical protein [Desulfobacterales bacterium]